MDTTIIFEIIVIIAFGTAFELIDHHENNSGEPAFQSLPEYFPNLHVDDYAPNINGAYKWYKYVFEAEAQNDALKDGAYQAIVDIFNETKECPVKLFQNLDATGYVSEGTGWYKLVPQAATWNEARKACEKDGAYLAIINSEDEAEHLRLKFNEERKEISKDAYNDWNAFIGIHDQFEEGDWVTIFSEPLDSTGYRIWANISGVQQPDNGGGYSDGVENCGSLTSGEIGLNDVPCHLKFAYFCELL